MAQRDMILGMLDGGRIVTALDALTTVGSFRLSARIHELRRLGCRIERVWITTPRGARIAGYRLAQEALAEKGGHHAEGE